MIMSTRVTCNFLNIFKLLFLFFFLHGIYFKLYFIPKCRKYDYYFTFLMCKYMIIQSKHFALSIFSQTSISESKAQFSGGKIFLSPSNGSLTLSWTFFVGATHRDDRRRRKKEEVYKTKKYLKISFVSNTSVMKF